MASGRLGTHSKMAIFKHNVNMGEVCHNFHKVQYQHSKQLWWVNMHIFVVNFLGYAATEYY